MPKSITFDHARHDPSLIAGHAAGDLAHADRAMADGLIAGCQSCAELRRDLVAIAAAMGSLPAPAAHHRDFQLSPTQAARLQRGSWLRNILRPFGATRSTLRPMAAAVTSLGVAGLFLATLMPGMLGSPAAAPGGARDREAVPAATGAAPEGRPGGELSGGGLYGQASTTAPQAAQPSPDRLGGVHVSNGGASAAPGYQNEDNATGAPPLAAAGGGQTHDAGAGQGGEAEPLVLDAGPPVNPLIAGSLALIGVGLLLFALRFVARRVR